MQFLKNILSTLVALMIFGLVLFILSVAIISAVTADETVNIKENSILHLKLNRPIMELEYEDPLAMLGIGNQVQPIGLVQLLQAIRHAETDDNISGIYLETPFIGAGFSMAGEIRNALEKFKSSGKFIISYSSYYSEGAYYLSSVADELYLHPLGDMELNGLNATIMFYSGLFEKLGIEAQVFRVGEYKSAVEPYLRKDMSDENREQLSELIAMLNNHIIEEIAQGRDLSAELVSEVSDSMLIRLPEDAVKLGFIDSLFYEDEMEMRLAAINEVEKDELEMVSLEKYSKSFSDYVSAKEEIAVIVGQGEIAMGGDGAKISARKMAKEIKKARENENIKGIVLRINSPGGSPLASDIIWREVKLAAREKAVVASFSDYAASGGYYIGMAADTIMVQPGTITGSIGIYGILFNLGDMMENKLGITVDQVSTGTYSGIYTMSRSLSESERQIIQNDVNNGYRIFVEKAAEGRNMRVEDLEKLAGGRVWSGGQAIENGLVDLYGGLFDAIELTADMAGVETYKTKFYPPKKSFLEELMGKGEASAEARLASELGQSYEVIMQLKNMVRDQGPQARNPWVLEIQ
ncbi:MAG: signal peptide peptidase SppA [Cyclobacteriaceae bacterium]|nr:signal peptide peptidase SppA [Cyclobacteriaceae bacterium]